MRVASVFDAAFRPYGKILEGYNFRELFAALGKTEVPEKGILYKASIPQLEACQIHEEFKDRGFGGMPIQTGCCNGTNDTLNCLEYHKSSEFNIPMDDIVLLLGLECDITDGKYDTTRIRAFYVPAGTGVELYGATLHYAPCGYRGDIFRVACVLPKGTNEPLDEKGKAYSIEASLESSMCLAKNKWLMAHPDSPEAGQGVYIGLKGEKIKYGGKK